MGVAWTDIFAGAHGLGTENVRGFGRFLKRSWGV